jgi:sulfate-transporting ATPase
MITGQEKPDSGELKSATPSKLAYVDQSRDALDPDKTVYQEISGGQRSSASTSAARDQRPRLRQPVQLQGRRPAEEGRRPLGRRAQPRPPRQAAQRGRQPAAPRRADQRPRRRHAARARGRAPQLPGCAVVISHDRWFLDRIATHILAFEGDSKVTWFEGNYQDYEADKKRRLGEDATTPHRIKYRKLTTG